jgi:hypothetical protein
MQYEVAQREALLQAQLEGLVTAHIGATVSFSQFSHCLL